MTRVPIPSDCRDCGVCCFSALPTYVGVTGADWARLGSEAERLAHFIGHRAYMKMSGDHCAALLRDPQTCRIYERRPQVCRDLERGSPACEGELARKAGAAPMTSETIGRPLILDCP